MVNLILSAAVEVSLFNCFNIPSVNISQVQIYPLEKIIMCFYYYKYILIRHNNKLLVVLLCSPQPVLFQVIIWKIKVYIILFLLNYTEIKVGYFYNIYPVFQNIFFHWTKIYILKWL